MKLSKHGFKAETNGISCMAQRLSLCSPHFLSTGAKRSADREMAP